MPGYPIIQLPVKTITDLSQQTRQDVLAVEEPLEIRIEFGPADNRQVKNVSVTMRTPGHDAELAAGFLFTEGIVKQASDIDNISYSFIACAENKENTIVVSLDECIVPHLQNTERNFYTTSSCGVCGKGSISAIRTAGAMINDDHNVIDAELLYQLPEILRQRQDVFEETGGLHASALFTNVGELLLLREDVGRHNALDKVIGACLLGQSKLPLSEHILMLSGRASFELIQKAAMAGINIIAAVGAPSSLAVQLAREFNITLVGFLRNRRFNIYTAGHRILVPEYEITH